MQHATVSVSAHVLYMHLKFYCANLKAFYSDAINNLCCSWASSAFFAFWTPSSGCQCVCWALCDWFRAVRLPKCLHLVMSVSVSIWILTTIFLPLALSPIVRTLIFSSCWSFWVFTTGTNDNFFLSTFCTNSKFTGTCERVLWKSSSLSFVSI